MKKTYWKGVEELSNTPEFEKSKGREFAEELPIEELFNKKASAPEVSGRRDFLKILGFGIGAATLAACEAPVRKTIPYLIKPEEITPGVANYYASSYFDGCDYCSILVKTREGRPIKIEGNNLSTVTNGGTNARVQGSVLSLYDSSRMKGPIYNKGPVSWSEADMNIPTKLNNIVREKKEGIRILSSTILSPSTKAVIEEFTKKFPGTKHIQYDAVSRSGMLDANEDTFGKRALPTYAFDKAKTIVSIGADFLANWISPVEHAAQYVKNRKLRGKSKEMSRHYQFETALSLTGSNADQRTAIKPSEHGKAVVALYNLIANKAGASTSSAISLGKSDKMIAQAADDLWENKGSALLVCGSNDRSVQVIVNEINRLLDSYGKTIDMDTPSFVRQGNDAEVDTLISEMNDGKVGALIIYNTNPYYTHPKAEDFRKGLSKVGLKISFADREDETAILEGLYVLPDHHYLESWNDAEPKKGTYSLCQPTIAPLFDTRSAQESLLKWTGYKDDYHTFIQDYWKKNIFHESKDNHLLFSDFWFKSLQEGVYNVETVHATSLPQNAKAKDAPEAKPVAKDEKKTTNMSASAKITAALSAITDAKGADGLEILLYEKTGIGNGNQSNNPWLQELPDPISKVCWDNYIAVSPAMAKEKNLTQGQVAKVSSNGVSVEVPVYIQPGQAIGTVSLALGYGRTRAGRLSNIDLKNVIGVSAYPFIQIANGSLQYFTGGVSVEGTTKQQDLAATQTHHTMMGRAPVRETELEEYAKDSKAGNETELFETADGKMKAEDLSLWASKETPGFARPDHQWGMSIDLNSCIGCGSCVVACSAENNVPVVGKDEIMRSREMHWIRIDRYYSSDTTEENAPKGTGAIDLLHKMEVPSENPTVVFQPVMCQHCNHAPCETVCPVIATSHSSEGLNQMAYNRCVGTRYCANNCPYKVRRFNWFKYSDNAQFNFNMNEDLGKMVLNPDVVVRSRGVMEKCSMCVQRIQEYKLIAKKEKRRIRDGEFNMACAQACPTNAITFGDWNNPESELSKEGAEDRSYHLLGELDVQPNIVYQTKVRNSKI